MSESTALIHVPFHDDTLEATQTSDGKVWVVLKRMCESLGIDHDSQRQKLKNKPWAATVLITAPDLRGSPQQHLCLELDCVPMWLATIELSRVALAVRPKLALYQVECAKVLREHFLGKNAPPVPAPAPIHTPSGREHFWATRLMMTFFEHYQEVNSMEPPCFTIVTELAFQMTLIEEMMHMHHVPTRIEDRLALIHVRSTATSSRPPRARTARSGWYSIACASLSESTQVRNAESSRIRSGRPLS